MERVSFKDMNCPVAQCLEIVGEWWTLLIIRDGFFGLTRFDQLQTSLGISRNVLAQRLSRLVEEGVMEKVVYQEHPPRHEYRLTAKGRDLWPVLTAMRQWGDRWASPGGPPLELVPKPCGHAAELVTTCSHCGEALSAGAMQALPGPGAVPG